MRSEDEIAAVNRQDWARRVKEGSRFTRPWLNLNRDLLRQCVAGQLDGVPEPLLDMCPVKVLADVEGKEVLCLASGGGQQSAVFGLLGARVTVVDVVEGQLEGDVAAAAHYGYEVTTVCADMRDLSCLGDGVFDMVYQAPSMGCIPDLRPVYAEVFRVLKPKGIYRVCFANPATEFVECDSWDRGGYRITKPYAERMEHYQEDGAPGSIQFRHHMADIFNGLIEGGFSIEQVEDSPKYFLQEGAEAEPGSWDHWLTYVGAFAVVARKG
jgi:ubiquinone/menaquinone biosynthesis C-methylase UbiE